MKHWLCLILFLALALPASAQGEIIELRDLVAPGHKVAVVFEDRNGDIDEKDAYIKQYLKEWSEWVLADKPEKADFILHVEGYSKWTDNSPTSKTYFMTAQVRNPAGKTLWTGEPVYDWANLGNGFRAVRGVSRQLVRSLILELRKLIGDAPVIVTV